ncbi:MAG: HEPN domain-containing protein [Sedimentisphaerales bacterium]|nr:HEPN domain-containing protein [Sedimentisphaerales bacterium]
MDKRAAEWLKQADYDIDTAEFMAKGGRYFYVVFMCHLAIEKALKGLYQQNLKQTPPKTHNLVYLMNKIGLKADQDQAKVIVRLNEANITTRYPDDIDKLKSDYTEEITGKILTEAKEILKWIKQQF